MKLKSALLACGAVLTCLFSNSFAIDEFKDIKTIQILPMTDAEVESAHTRSRGETCELIAAGELTDTKTFVMNLTDRDRKENTRRPPSARHSLLSVGLSIDATDQNDLPKLSRSTILSYLEEHFVVIQARVRQDLLDRKLYFHHRPIAVTTQFTSPRLSVPFEPVIANSIQEFHSLGLFTPNKTRLKPEDLRTLVLLLKNNTVSGNRIRPQYDYAFIQGIPDRTGKTLEHHVFVTSENRQKLNYLRDYRLPKRSRECSILGNVLITDYDASGIFPKESATKSYKLNAGTSFTMAQIGSFCETEGLIGGLPKNLDKVLLAAKEGRIATK